MRSTNGRQLEITIAAASASLLNVAFSSMAYSQEDHVQENVLYAQNAPSQTDVEMESQLAAEEAQILWEEQQINWLSQRARQSFRETEAGKSRPFNRPAPGDEAGKGFFQVPGTNTAVRIYGYTKVNAIYDARPAGDPDQFVTSSIPTDPTPRKPDNFNIHAKDTTVRFEVRRPTHYGDLKVFIENDFFNSETGYEYQLSNAYGQIGNFYAGYGYTAFSDMDALPNTLDNEGPNGSIFLRSGAFRYHWQPREHATITLSAERPITQFSGGPLDATGASRAPDLIASLRLDHCWGYVQAGALGRYLLVEEDTQDESKWGGGAQISGVLHTFNNNSIQFQLLSGKGIARYVNDLGGTGLDAVLEDGPNMDEFDLDTLHVNGGYLAYTHNWNKDWSSNLVASMVSVDHSEELANSVIFDTSVRETRYAVLNLLWTPPKSGIMAGIEALYGYKQDQAGITKEAGRIQMSVKYNFFGL